MCIKISLRWEGSLITTPISNNIGWAFYVNNQGNFC